MEYYNVNVTSGETTGTIVPLASLDIDPVTTTLTLSGDTTQVRAIVLPPWPIITRGSHDSTDPSASSTSTEIIIPTTFPPPNYPPHLTFDKTTKPPYTPPTTEDDDDTPIVTWPPSLEIHPVETEVPEDGEDDDDDGPKFKSPCDLWFFTVDFETFEEIGLIANIKLVLHPLA